MVEMGTVRSTGFVERLVVSPGGSRFKRVWWRLALWVLGKIGALEKRPHLRHEEAGPGYDIADELREQLRLVEDGKATILVGPEAMVDMRDLVSQPIWLGITVTVFDGIPVRGVRWLKGVLVVPYRLEERDGS
ncbi:hypothetical protein CMI37_22680 [Candidatus Pacearchaeota archaeon]|nr:hypothetical protein [Candidatus Pacearchaeota archaeon]